ncbi:TadE/TadG family type IV pilus assembly protein [Tabrizicola sp.]|uniref:TadE/TadG family type IV pilus assembly protein n=1 Tax=Tabrizicola sp. TaxID=2005166 RepID=UPI003D270A1B
MAGFWKDETGAVAVYVALTAPILIGFAALAVEAGSWILTQRSLQQVADTVAYSTAVRKFSVNSTNTLVNFAGSRANEMGLRSSDIFTVNPNYGQPAPNGEDVEVTIERVLPRQLTKIFTSEPDVTISVRAVAGIDQTSGVPACIIVLSPDDAGAFTIGGSAELIMEDCAAGSNSGADDSFRMNGSANALEATCVYTTGGARLNGGEVESLSDCSDIQVYQRPSLDPYADLVFPSFPNNLGADDVETGKGQNKTREIGPDRNLSVTTNGVVQEYPAARFASLKLDGDVSFEPGVYIIDGGKLEITAQAVLSGSGVSFYLTNGAELDVKGGATINLSGYSGSRNDPYNGLLFFSDRVPETKQIEHKFVGNSDTQVNGVMYFPVDKVTFTGTSSGAQSVSSCLWVISYELLVNGNTEVNLNECTTQNWAPKIEIAQRVRLLE